MSKKDDDGKNISNIKVSTECYIEIKVASVRKQVSIQEIVSETLEKVFNKRNKGEITNIE